MEQTKAHNKKKHWTVETKKWQINKIEMLQTEDKISKKKMLQIVDKISKKDNNLVIDSNKNNQ